MTEEATKKKTFDYYTHGEARTGVGQLVSFSSAPGDVEKIKWFIQENIRNIQLPQTKFLHNIRHGSYGQYTRYDIVQHKYGGGGSGFVEVLEIKDPPDGRWGIILYERPDAEHKSFSEWETVEDAKCGYNKFWSSQCSNDRYAKLKGFKRLVRCGLLDPWFYAIGDEELVGDYAFPDGLQDDPVFRFGKKFVVYTGPYHNEKAEIKTCMGTRIIEREIDYHGKKTRTERVVCWHDGTVWYDSFCNSEKRPRELEEGELWISEAMDQFKAILSGGKTDFAIDFTDGTKFVGKIVANKGKKIYVEAKYLLGVTFKDGTTKDGWLDFKPTVEEPDIISLVTRKFELDGQMVEKVEIKEQKTPTKGKKWSGVFFKKGEEK